jgi:large subunit ribosomal protein L35
MFLVETPCVFSEPKMAKSKARCRKIRLKERPSAKKIKIKTKRAAAKRYKVLGSGKVKVPHTNKQHLTGHKSRKHKNRLRKGKLVRAENMLLVKRCLPNSF